ncbi:MAG: TGS domain-containing protein [Chloroflexi bacterium]|nr:TGS domain-containing protein [Chloroflexota bacterium]
MNDPGLLLSSDALLLVRQRVQRVAQVPEHSVRGVTTMPANLPPQYIEAEKEFRSARSPQQKIEALERMLAIMPHHKGTDHLRAELRSRMAKLAQEAERQRSAGGKTQFSTVRKEGAGQAMLAGRANAGKSALLASLTDASARVADYPFTTQLPQPAMMPFEDIHVQLVDLPPIVPAETPGWVRGLLRQADLLLLIVDLSGDPLADLHALLDELEGFRIQAVPPDGSSDDDGEHIPKPAILVANKVDSSHALEIAELLTMEVGDRLPLLTVSATRGDGLEDLRRRIVEALRVVRIYAKPPGRPPDLHRPFVLPRGATVSDLAEEIHRGLPEKLKYAVLWPADRPALRVARGYVLRDRDVIELRGG